MRPEDYKKLRDKYKPKVFKRVFILESPPVSGLYFYNPDGKITESLFSAMMKYVLKYEPENKQDGLEKFKKSGYFLVDAIYEPVNKIKSKSLKDKKIVNNYFKLSEDLKNIIKNKKIALILIKRNICIKLEDPLINDGFQVKNKGVVIPFPSHGNQKRFGKIISKYLD